MLRRTDGILAGRLLKYRALSWLPAYLRDRSAKRGIAEPTDLVVCITDHFEPPMSAGERAYQSVRDWVDAYRDATAGILDAEGSKPKHTWFYRFDFLDERCVHELALACWEGLGEIEFHLHHGYDDQESFRRRLYEGLALGSRYGAMLGREARPSFGYIAGDWALNNGTGSARHSGCDDEISVLRAEGCFADFTFPALGSKAQPRRVNAIYYAPPGKGRSAYQRGPDAAVGVTPPADGFLMVQGPTILNRQQGTIEYAAVEVFSRYHPSRIAEWVGAGVGVVGRPEWRIVKLHTHGIQSHVEYRGRALTDLYAGLCDYARSRAMRVHFVTARELVNIVQAAVDGRSGDAGAYRDYRLPPPPNVIVRCANPVRVEAYAGDTLTVAFEAPVPVASVRIAGREVHCAADAIAAVDVLGGARRMLRVRGQGAGTCSPGRGATRPLLFRDGVAEVGLDEPA
jgi:hypothetical protein